MDIVRAELAVQPGAYEMAGIKGHGGHVFGRTRPSHGGRNPIHVTPERDTHYRDLPDPIGPAPYHLDLRTILAADAYSAIERKKRLTFHMNGDMGGIKDAMPQELVAKGMEQDFDPQAAAGENPAFLYINGDCVYFNGEIKEYYSQFYHPYELYPEPIFAVPGNHDGENLDLQRDTQGNVVVNGTTTLDGFLRNFCQKTPVKMPESGSSNRTAMVQPNVYWTLLTPVLSIVGLYSNVPEGGEIKPPQTDWLADELRTLPGDRPIIVALHHPVYSADDHHSGSTHMKRVIENAAAAAGRHPEMIVAGHVHDYQRLTKNMDDGSQIPYLVVGAGGYHNLHHIQKVDGQRMIAPVIFEDKQDDPVTLETYSDDHFGFLRLEVSADLIVGKYYEVPRPQEPFSKGNHLLDYFEFDWANKKYVPNRL